MKDKEKVEIDQSQALKLSSRSSLIGLTGVTQLQDSYSGWYPTVNIVPQLKLDTQMVHSERIQVKIK